MFQRKRTGNYLALLEPRWSSGNRRLTILIPAPEAKEGEVDWLPVTALYFSISHCPAASAALTPCQQPLVDRQPPGNSCKAADSTPFPCHALCGRPTGRSGLEGSYVCLTWTPSNREVRARRRHPPHPALPSQPAADTPWSRAGAAGSCCAASGGDPQGRLRLHRWKPPRPPRRSWGRAHRRFPTSR